MITLTESATKAVRRFIRSSGGTAAGLRIQVTGGGCSGFQYEMNLEETPKADDVVVGSTGVALFVDPASAALLNGLTVDFVDTLDETGFTFTNPNATGSCGCGKSFSA